MQNGQTAQVIEIPTTPPTRRRPDTAEAAFKDAIRSGIQAFTESLALTATSENTSTSPQTSQAIALLIHQIGPDVVPQMYRQIMTTMQKELKKAEQNAKKQTKAIINQSQRPVLFIDHSMAEEDMSMIGFMLQRTDLMFICGDKTIENAMLHNGICKGQFQTSYLGTKGCPDTQANVSCIASQSDCFIHLGFSGVEAKIIGNAKKTMQQIHLTTMLPDKSCKNIHSHIETDRTAMINSLSDMVHTQHANRFSLSNATWKYYCRKSSNRYAKNCYGLQNFTR